MIAGKRRGQLKLTDSSARPTPTLAHTSALGLQTTRESHIPANVEEDVIRKAFNGSVKCRKAGYLAVAAYTPTNPTASPATPPASPPLSVALWNLGLHASVSSLTVF